MDAMRRDHNGVKGRIIDEALGLFPRPKVLDVGCGAGGDIMKFVRAGAEEVLAIDPDVEALDEARARLAGLESKHLLRGTSFAIRNCGVQDVQVSGRGFDVATCMFSAHFVLAEEGALDHLYGVMSPGSVVVGALLERGRVIMGDYGHYTAREAGPHLVDFGLKDRTRYFAGRSRVEPLWDSEEVIERFMGAGFRLVWWKNFGDLVPRGSPLHDVSKMYSAFMFRRPCTDPEAPRSS